jgi:hypothetical protein
MSVTGREQFEQSAEDEAAEELALAQAYGAEDLEPKPDDLQDDQAKDPEPPAPTEEPPAEEPPAPTLSVNDLVAMIETERTENQKLRDRVFGKIGDLQQRIDAIKSTAGGISPMAKERLAADFPELAEMLFDNSQEPPSAFTPAPQPPPTGADKEELEQAFEKRLLKRDHPDWERVVISPEFTEFKKTLDPKIASELDDSWDADFVSPKITEFKQWQADLAAKQKADQEKADRLESAIVPKGVPRTGTASGGADSEEEAMMAAYGRK